jgi:hypothetical protein
MKTPSAKPLTVRNQAWIKRIVATLFILTSSALAQLEPNAGTWQTWVLSSGQELRLAPPPDAAMTEEELEQLATLAAERDTADLEQIHFWDTGSPGFRWNELAVQHTLKNSIGGPRAARIMALVNVAIYDAMVAA